ncbi:MAG: ParB N-terminal domain-containing protein [Phycisphaerales bacterium]|nr:ParB N-terminal domain-containing protein [Phycisphaerales bacterium]
MATAPTTTIKPTIPAAKFSTEIKPGAVVKAMTAAAAGAVKGSPFTAPLSALRVMDDFNPRVTGTTASEEAMAELVNSIRVNGFYADKPISVFVAADGDGNVLYLKDGHRRFEAVQRVNAAITEANAVEGATQTPLIESLPVVATPAGKIEDMMIEVAQSGTGLPLTMFEKGLLAKRLIDADMAKDDIASRLSMTERHLNNVLLLASAPAALRDMIVTDKVTPTTALKLMKDPKTAVAKAKEMLKASEAKGKAKATPKDSAAPKMVKSNITVEFKAGGSIKDTLKDLAAFVREHVGHDSEDAISTLLGNVTITVATPAPVVEKPAKAPKAPKAEKPAKAPKAPKVTAAQAKAAAQAHLGGAAAGTAPAAAPASTEDLSGL